MKQERIIVAPAGDGHKFKGHGVFLDLHYG
jgi:hypothetical protein